MDVEGLQKARDIRVHRRVLLVDKWQERVVETLKKRKMGSHQVGEVSGKPQEEGREKGDVGQSRIGDWKDRSQNDKEDPSL